MKMQNYGHFQCQEGMCCIVWGYSTDLAGYISSYTCMIKLFTWEIISNNTFDGKGYIRHGLLFYSLLLWSCSVEYLQEIRRLGTHAGMNVCLLISSSIYIIHLMWRYKIMCRYTCSEDLKIFWEYHIIDVILKQCLK